APSRAGERGPAAAPRTEQAQPIREATASPSARQEPVNLDWEAVVARVLAERPNIGAFLEESGLVGAAGDLVTVGLPASAGTAMRMMQQESYQQAVADACSALAGRPLRVRVVSLEGGTGDEDRQGIGGRRHGDGRRKRRDGDRLGQDRSGSPQGQRRRDAARPGGGRCQWGAPQGARDGGGGNEGHERGAGNSRALLT